MPKESSRIQSSVIYNEILSPSSCPIIFMGLTFPIFKGEVEFDDINGYFKFQGLILSNPGRGDTLKPSNILKYDTTLCLPLEFS
jgi:hypothetical protein